MDTILEFKNIVKKYPGVVALNDVSVTFEKGKVHALVGENGAGKSTLIKTCTGAIRPTGGTILLNGEPYDGFTPILSKKCGISVIYQEFDLVNELSVAENIFLGDPIKKGWILDKKQMSEKTQAIMEQLGIEIDPNTLVKNLSVGYQQLVEIAKALSRETKILIMDEPSAPLTTAEVEIMFAAVRKLKQQGVTIIYISHRLEEIFEISDKVSVLRDGQLLTTLDTKSTNRDELVRLMVGRELKESFPKRSPLQSADTLLELKHLSGNGLKDVSIKLKKGEILGLGGLIGAGRTELAQILFGVAPVDKGEIVYKGERISLKNPRDAIKKGIALVPEDRKQQGVLLHLSIAENIVMPSLKKISRFSVIDRKTEKKITESYKEALRIKTPNLSQTVNNLSGGNQQKVVLAKWMATEPEIIIFDEPTRGIDVGAKYEIYLLMDELVKQGKTLIMISSEMPELIGMSDRIIVLSEGKITGEIPKEEFSQETILHYASLN